MSQSSVIAFALLLGFFVYITIRVDPKTGKSELTAYRQVIGL